MEKRFVVNGEHTLGNNKVMLKSSPKKAEQKIEIK